MDGTEHVGSILGRILERLEALDTRWDGAGPLDLEAAALEHVEQRTGRMRRRTDVLTLDTCRALIRALELEKKRSRELHLLASAALSDAELAAAEPAQLQRFGCRAEPDSGTRWNAYRMDLRRVIRGAEPLSAPRLDPIEGQETGESRWWECANPRCQSWGCALHDEPKGEGQETGDVAEPLSAPRLDPIDPDDGDPAELEARENPGGLEAESAELEAQR